MSGLHCGPQVCPSPSDVTPWRWTVTPADFQHPFLLQVSSYDRVGVLHGALSPRS